MKRLDKQGKQKGFTIIELVVVILLLGILTATALPRFIDVTDEAHNAAVDGVLGGIGTGAALFRAQWFANSQPARVAEFGNMVANASGYPLGIISGTLTGTVLRSVGTVENCVEVFQNLLQPAGQPTILGTTANTNAPGAVGTLTSAPGAYDFVAYLNNTDSTTRKTCYYFYTGQFVRPADTTSSIPAIVYEASTGSVTRTTY